MSFTTADLIRLNNLRLAGKLVSDELLLGTHRGKRTGSGVEFEQYRHYEPGDDPKGIDWKLYARTGKHLTKEATAESHTRIRFFLDLSGSMNYEENGVSRLDYARILIASLAYLGFTQGDALSLATFADGQFEVLAESGKHSLRKILFSLESVTARGTLGTENGQDLVSALDISGRQKEVLVIVSDLIPNDNEWLEALKSWAGPRRELVIFCLSGEKETQFDFKGFYRFHDLETGKETELQAEQVKELYLRQSRDYWQKMEEELQLPHVQLIRASLEQPVGWVLRQFLSARKNP